MSITCSEPKCSQHPITRLACNNQIMHFCNNHLDVHKNLCSLEHRSFTYLKNISNPESTISSLKEIIKSFEDAHQWCIFDLNQIINQLTKIYHQKASEIQSIKKYCKFLLKEVLSTTQIPIIYTAETIDKPKVEIDDMKSEINAFCQKAFTESLNYILNLNELTTKIQNKVLKCISTPNTNLNIDNNLYFFTNESKFLVQFDTQTLTYSKKLVAVNENQGILQSVCSISSTEIFFTGGYSEDKDIYISSCYIINKNTGAVKVLPKGRKRYAAQALAYKQGVYIFGGYDGGFLNSSDLFDLRSKTWKNLLKLPVALSSTTSVVLKEKEIFVVGSESNKKRHFLCYNIESNLFRSINAEFAMSYWRNLIVKYGDNLFLIMGENILKSNVSNVELWQILRGSVNFEASSSRPVIRGKKAFFVFSNKKVCQLDLESLELNIVTEIQ